jgi:hypothetical protein
VSLLKNKFFYPALTDAVALQFKEEARQLKLIPGQGQPVWGLTIILLNGTIIYGVEVQNFSRYSPGISVGGNLE